MVRFSVFCPYLSTPIPESRIENVQRMFGALPNVCRSQLTGIVPFTNIGEMKLPFRVSAVKFGEQLASYGNFN